MHAKFEDYRALKIQMEKCLFARSKGKSLHSCTDLKLDWVGYTIKLLTANNLGVNFNLKKGQYMAKINTVEESEFNSLSVFGISETETFDFNKLAIRLTDTIDC